MTIRPLPIASLIFERGKLRHQRLTCSWSVVASFTPCSVRGCLPTAVHSRRPQVQSPLPSPYAAEKRDSHRRHTESHSPSSFDGAQSRHKSHHRKGVVV